MPHGRCTLDASLGIDHYLCWSRAEFHVAFKHLPTNSGVDIIFDECACFPALAIAYHDHAGKCGSHWCFTYSIVPWHYQGFIYMEISSFPAYKLLHDQWLILWSLWEFIGSFEINEMKQLQSRISLAEVLVGYHFGQNTLSKWKPWIGCCMMPSDFINMNDRVWLSWYFSA